MRSKRISILVLAALIVVGASAFALASLGGDGNEGNQNINVIHTGPGGSDCNCPAIWQPVVCKGADGSRNYFSSACIAGCNGFTKCARIDDAGLLP